ncbi:MAG: hypothetical protein PVJ17_11145, partial [Lysobacterales bacterium]
MRMIGRFMVIVCVLVAAVALFPPAGMAAQADKCGIKRDVGTKALDEVTWKQLNSIYADVGEEKYDEAYTDLKKMMKRAGRDDYLQAILDQALAQ